MILNLLILVFLILGGIAGFKKGFLKTTVQLVGLIAIVIISYALKGGLAEFFINHLPFFEFGGLTALNVLMYNLIAFLIIFAVLMAVLNFVLKITGFIDTILNFTVIWIIPSKIGGIIMGVVEAWLYIFLCLFVLIQIGFTSKFVTDSSMSNFMLDNTPVMANFLGGASKAAKSIYAEVRKNTSDEEKDITQLNTTILGLEANYGIITKAKAQELMDTGKIDIDNVMFGKGNNKWSNI